MKTPTLKRVFLVLLTDGSYYIEIFFFLIYFCYPLGNLSIRISDSP